MTLVLPVDVVVVTFPGRATNSVNASARATAPISASASSTCSSGECETPVGLRTNNMAVGITELRTPAS